MGEILDEKKKINSGMISWLISHAGQVIFLLSLVVLMSIISPQFRTTNNLIKVCRQASINMIIACAMTMVLIIGGIDLSVGSVMAMAGMVATLLSVRGIPFAFCMFGGLLSGVIAGFVNGIILANTKLPAFIVTYAIQSILRGMVYVITGAGTIRLTSDIFLKFGGGFLGTIPLPVIYMLIVIVFSILILSRSKFGRHMLAIGGNSKAALYAGINTRRVTLIIYVISGFCAALAGLVLTSRNSSMQPAVGNGAEMDAIAAVVLGGTSMAGGRGSISGTILGAFIIAFINNGLNMLQMDSFYQYIAKGVVILIAVYLDDIKNQRIALEKK